MEHTNRKGTKPRHCVMSIAAAGYSQHTHDITAVGCCRLNLHAEQKCQDLFVAPWTHACHLRSLPCQGDLGVCQRQQRRQQHSGSSKKERCGRCMTSPPYYCCVLVLLWHEHCCNFNNFSWKWPIALFPLPTWKRTISNYITAHRCTKRARVRVYVFMRVHDNHILVMHSHVLSLICTNYAVSRRTYYEYCFTRKIFVYSSSSTSMQRQAAASWSHNNRWRW